MKRNQTDQVSTQSDGWMTERQMLPEFVAEG